MYFILHIYRMVMRGSRILQGGWGSRPDARKQSGQGFFSPQLILQFTEGVQWFYCRENYTFLVGRGGVKMLISIETHITCDLSGGIRSPYPPSGSAHEGKALYNTGQVRTQRSFANFCLSYDPFLTYV